MNNQKGLLEVEFTIKLSYLESLSGLVGPLQTRYAAAGLLCSVRSVQKNTTHNGGECKSWELNGIAFQKFVEGTSGSVQQFKTYLSDQTRVTSMDKLEYWFDGKKGVTESQVKEKFKQMMYNGTTLTTQGTAVFNAIWGNSALRGNLFPETVGLNANDLSNIKPSILGKFQTNVSSITNGFYDFIKVK